MSSNTALTLASRTVDNPSFNVENYYFVHIFHIHVENLKK